jgi:hypothetical protein
MLDARCERVFLVENAGKDVVSYSIVGLGEAEIFRRTKALLITSTTPTLVGYYPGDFDDVHAYIIHPVNAKDVPGTDTPADAFLSKI